MSRSIQIEQLPLYQERYVGRGREGKGSYWMSYAGTTDTAANTPLNS